MLKRRGKTSCFGSFTFHNPFIFHSCPYADLFFQRLRPDQLGGSQSSLASFSNRSQFPLSAQEI
jgi:hypothetical protein